MGKTSDAYRKVINDIRRNCEELVERIEGCRRRIANCFARTEAIFKLDSGVAGDNAARIVWDELQTLRGDVSDALEELKKERRALKDFVKDFKGFRKTKLDSLAKRKDKEAILPLLVDEFAEYFMVMESVVRKFEAVA